MQMKMQSIIEEILPTTYYQLINANTNFALYLSSGSLDFLTEKVYICQPNEESFGQIWQIIRIPDSILFTNCFEIVHTRSTFVLTKLAPGVVRLRMGKWDTSQLYHIQEAENGAVVFVSQENKQWLLHFDNHELKLGPFDRNHKKCQWYLLPCTGNPNIRQSCYFENILSHQVIDIPRASLKAGCELIQYPLNNRFNQRFYIHESGGYFKISSPISKMYLTAHKYCREGDRVTQEELVGKDESKQKHQIWIIEYQGNNSFLIRSSVNRNMCLGIRKNEYRKETPLVTTSILESSLWKIVGFLPNRHQLCNI